ncbi:MAG: tRNA pseudouridine(38-40) synthase TruA [Bacilli bacterium]|nr:tRNA pseudouridine(38-40) synthase TruA [Bacilli bacterium]
MRYLITFSYDGSKYSGYQKQPKMKTVQGELEKALKTLNDNTKVVLNASGRTDAGVHALNQKAHFDLQIKITPEKLQKALNSMIPDTIYIKKAEIVDDSFHARFDVVAKEYVYKINLGEYNPIEKDYILQYNKPLDVVEMERALKYLEGTHNFRSFVKIDEEKESYERTLVSANLIRDVKHVNTLTLSFLGTGFMRYMVRNIVGTLIEIGEGKRKSEDMIPILKEENRMYAGKTALPNGLYLKDVFYR